MKYNIVFVEVVPTSDLSFEIILSYFFQEKIIFLDNGTKQDKVCTNLIFFFYLLKKIFSRKTKAIF